MDTNDRELLIRMWEQIKLLRASLWQSGYATTHDARDTEATLSRNEELLDDQLLRDVPLLLLEGEYKPVTLNLAFDPSATWKRESCREWYTDDDFRTWIVPLMHPKKANEKIPPILRYRVNRTSLRDECPNNQLNGIFDPSDFGVWLAAKISEQTNGMPGELSTDSANNFLVRDKKGNPRLIIVELHKRNEGWFQWSVGMPWTSRPLHHGEFLGLVRSI